MFENQARRERFEYLPNHLLIDLLEPEPADLASLLEANQVLLVKTFEDGGETTVRWLFSLSTISPSSSWVTNRCATSAAATRPSDFLRMSSTYVVCFDFSGERYLAW